MISERYKKNLGLLGEKGQKKLLNSHVAIIGAGGLGGTVFEILVRYGVGKITIVDFDSFEPTNLNRQLLSSVNLLGKNKATAAKGRAKEINPDVLVTAIQDKLTEENSVRLIKDSDLVCDCLGNISDRFVLQRAAQKSQIPMVHAAVAGNACQVMTVFPGDSGLKTIYGREENAPQSGNEMNWGTPPSAVWTAASLQAHEAVAVLTGIQEPLHNKILRVNLKTWRAVCLMCV